MRSALVLNATYEPLSVVAARRATCLVLADKADLVADDGHQLHSARLVLPSPSVVRLRYVVRVPFVRRTAMSRRALFTRDDYRCQYCGDYADSLDHVVPRSKGGESIWENVVTACAPCNLRKGDRLLADSGLHLRRQPRPPAPVLFIHLATPTIPQVWQQYLPGAA